MDRLRGPPVLNAGNKQQTDPVRFSDGISNKKGMTMNLKNKKGKRLTETGNYADRSLNDVKLNSQEIFYAMAYSNAEKTQKKRED